MSRSYPIWHNVDACIYKSNKSYGAKDTSVDKIVVGSSKSNSHLLAEVITTKRIVFNDELNRSTIVFKISIDGDVIKSLTFEDNNGKAGDIIDV